MTGSLNNNNNNLNNLNNINNINNINNNNNKINNNKNNNTNDMGALALCFDPLHPPSLHLPSSQTSHPMVTNGFWRRVFLRIEISIAKFTNTSGESRLKG